MNENFERMKELLEELKEMIAKVSPETREEIAQSTQFIKDNDLYETFVEYMKVWLEKMRACLEQIPYVYPDKPASEMQDGISKKLTDNPAKGQALVEILSSQARRHDEKIEQRRAARYEEMAVEGKEVASLLDRRHR